MLRHLSPLNWSEAREGAGESVFGLAAFCAKTGVMAKRVQAKAKESVRITVWVRLVICEKGVREKRKVMRVATSAQGATDQVYTAVT